jgi:hypothetical protein
MFTVLIILVLGALVAAIGSAMGKAPLWVAVILLAVAMALQVLPAR